MIGRLGTALADTVRLVKKAQYTPPQSTVRCQARRAGVPVMRTREHAAPGCAVRQDGGVHEHLVGRRRLEDAPAPQTRRIWPANLARQAPWPEAGRTYHLGAAPGSPWRSAEACSARCWPKLGWLAGAGNRVGTAARRRLLEFARMGEHEVTAARPLRGVAAPAWLGWGPGRGGGPVSGTVRVMRQVGRDARVRRHTGPANSPVPVGRARYSALPCEQTWRGSST